jgi:predicted phage terminase large subunit-like protein
VNVVEYPPEVRVWRPNLGPQTNFLSSTAYELLYGGAAGGGKSMGLVIGALRHVDKSGYNGIIFRRTFPELEGLVIPKAQEWYPAAGGIYNSAKHFWRFPSGARIHFGHLEHEDDKYRYQGWEFQYAGFDELTQFTHGQYTYLLSRLRSSHGIPVRVRSTSNPGGAGHEWVMRRWAPWLDPEAVKRADPGCTLYYANTGDGEEWIERHPGALSRVFIPARVEDNPHLAKNDPAYVDRLRGLDRVTREQLLHGNWLIRPAAGLYFKREWFRIIERAPETQTRVRRWDLASTEDGGDWTVGVLMSRNQEGWCVEDVIRGRWRPKGVEQAIYAAAEGDPIGTMIVLPQDPGQAGVAQKEAYAKLLAGYNVRFERETGDKITRAQPFSAQCEAKNISLVRGRWNEPFLQCLEAFPEGGHDDDVDAAAGAFNAQAKRTTMDLWMQADIE